MVVGKRGSLDSVEGKHKTGGQGYVTRWVRESYYTRMYSTDAPMTGATWKEEAPAMVGAATGAAGASPRVGCGRVPGCRADKSKRVETFVDANRFQTQEGTMILTYDVVGSLMKTHF